MDNIKSFFLQIVLAIYATFLILMAAVFFTFFTPLVLILIIINLDWKRLFRF